MKKKRYITPTSDIVVISTPTFLLSGSNTGLGSDPSGEWTRGKITVSDYGPIDDGTGSFED